MRYSEILESNALLTSLAKQDQDERNEYLKFVKSHFGNNASNEDWSNAGKMYAELKNRPTNDIFNDRPKLSKFIKMKFDFNKFTEDDWDNYCLLVQHCDDYIEFQKQALAIIKKYYHGPDHSHYQYLYDRISVALTGKQKYGTQNSAKIDPNLEH